MRGLPNRPNIVILITDQQRALQHWPAKWEEENLPSLMRLKNHGLTFSHAFTSATACSSSRATLLTGTYPETNGVKNTLQMPGDIINSNSNTALQQLCPSDPNIARILQAAGYRVVWKGKWHLSLPRDGGNTWTEEDIRYMKEAYGFSGWNPNDAGNSEAVNTTLGAGAGDNDARYVKGNSDDSSPPGESALEFIANVDPKDGPFCLIVSLVNPHDIWVAPNFNSEDGYTADLGAEFDLPVPDNVDEGLSTKPEVQAIFKAIMASGDNDDASLTETENQEAYVNFYAYLQTLADQHLGEVLDALDERRLTEKTLIIRLSDHGEMGLSHGLREKDFVAYDEAIRIPMIFSNPRAFRRPQQTDSLASLVDIAPTLASLTGVYDQFRYVFKGKDLMPILTDPTVGVQQYVHFTTDDAAVAMPASVPAFIRAIRSRDWMYAVYFTSDGSDFDYEMYDMQADPEQNTNLAGLPEWANQQQALHERLEEAIVAADTLPEDYMLMTPALAEIYPDGSCPNPVWPTPTDAVSDSQGRRTRRQGTR